MTQFSALNGKVVVTGGAGLIGSVLCRALLAAGAAEVIAIDPRQSEPTTPLPNEGSRFSRIRAGVGDAPAKQAIKGASCVFHLAASTHMQWSHSEPRRDIEGGLAVTLSVLETLRTSTPTKFIFCSSSAVYGAAAAHPVHEDVGPLLPYSTYGAAKLASEAWLSAYSHLVGFPAIICRLGNIISGALDRGALLDIVRQIAVSGRVELLGNGEQARTYLAADRCADALIFLATLSMPVGPTVVNVSGRGLISTRDLVRLACETMGVRAAVRPTSSNAAGWIGDVPVVNLDVTRLNAMGWSPPASEDAVRDAAAAIAARFSRDGPNVSG